MNFHKITLVPNSDNCLEKVALKKKKKKAIHEYVFTKVHALKQFLKEKWKLGFPEL